MSKAWPTVTLGEVVRHRNDFIEIDDTTEYKRCRVQLHAKGIVLRDIVPGAEIKTKQQQVCQAGEFLVAEIDAKVGGFGIVPDDLADAIVSSEQVTAQGTTNYAAIRPSHVLAYTITLPPLAEQRRIVAKIEQLASKIEEARGLRVSVREQSTALITSLHFGFAQQRTRSMQDILTLEELQEPVTPTGSYPQVGIKSFGLGLFPKKAVSGGETTYKHFNRLETGMVVLSQVKGWEGAIAVCPSHLAGFYASPEYRTLSCRKDASLPEYMAAEVSTPWFRRQLEIATHGVGGRRERVRPEKFLKLTIPMPTIEKQTQAVEVFRRLRAIEPMQAQTAAELDALLPSILDRAFRGEL